MRALSERQHGIIEFIIRDYIHTAQPVASERIRKRARLSASTATIRNEMGMLADNGLLKQPHASSGRIPTQKAYRYFVNNCIEQARYLFQEERGVSVWPQEECALTGRIETFTDELALFGALGVFGKERRVIVRGVKSFVAQPELRSNTTMLADFAYLLDHIDEALWEYRSASIRSRKRVAVFIGKENPMRAMHSFSVFCNAGRTQGRDVVFLSLGPMRMDYERALDILSSSLLTV